MSLTETDKEIIIKTWALVRININQTGIELFKRFFESNPDYIKYFPFHDLKTLDDILKDDRLKLHAGRVMLALSSIVDNLNEPLKFKEELNKILKSHYERKIELKQFENLKQALLNLLIDKLGNEQMNQEAQDAWSKAFDVIADAYKTNL